MYIESTKYIPRLYTPITEPKRNKTLSFLKKLYTFTPGILSFQLKKRKHHIAFPFNYIVANEIPCLYRSIFYLKEGRQGGGNRTLC